MTLQEFLEQRQRDSRGPAEQRQKIADYSAAVQKLMARFRRVLEPYEKLELHIEEWLPRLQEHAIPYNAVALTVSFRDDQITIEPKGTFVLDSEGRVEMSRGKRIVHLDWVGHDDWTFRWVIPRATEPEILTDQAIEDLVQGLLA